jgi:hypothetical protein
MATQGGSLVSDDTDSAVANEEGGASPSAVRTTTKEGKKAPTMAPSASHAACRGG